jgi:hypothetical protein
MTTNPVDPREEKRRTDDAWNKLQTKLAAEPVNAKWAAWPDAEQPAEHGGLNNAVTESGEMQSASDRFVDARISGQDVREENAAVPAAQTRPERRRPNRARRKWAGIAAACCLFGAILATPIGNHALAAILNQFRMQDITVVNEQDLQNIFTQITENGKINENNNKFGTFSNEFGTLEGNYTTDEASKLLGYKLTPGGVAAAGKTVSVFHSTTLTFNLNVDEVNKAMKRLGAKKLMPETVDGKPITLLLPEIVNYNLSTDDKHWSSLSQQNAPVVTVDPSIQVEEALEAVLNFPLLPDYLKQSLRQSRILSGAIPMPIITDGLTEQITMDGTVVILEQRDYSDGIIYLASWIKDGQLIQFDGGNMFTTKEAFTDKLQELIQ